MAVAVVWVEAPATGPFLLLSTAEFVVLVTGESMVSGNLLAMMEVLEVGGSAGATPFTSTGAEGSWGSGGTSDSG